MKLGIALGITSHEMARAVLETAVLELGKGNSVELFLVFNGVDLYELIGKDPALAKLLDEALEGGLTFTACNACEVVHGAHNGPRRRKQPFRHLFALWRRSDRFVFAGRFSSPETVRERMMAS